MGFSTIIDILGSILIGGILLLVISRMNNAAAENTYNNSQDLILQQNLTSVVGVLESDLRRMGYCRDWNNLPDPTKAIRYADSTHIKFMADIDNNGTVDTVEYYTGPTSELTQTPNPNDRYLYRLAIGSSDPPTKFEITEFSLVYFNTFGDTLSSPVTQPKQIASIQVNIRMEDAESYNSSYGGEHYVTAFWRQIKLTAMNLRNR